MFFVLFDSFDFYFLILIQIYPLLFIYLFQSLYQFYSTLFNLYYFGWKCTKTNLKLKLKGKLRHSGSWFSLGETSYSNNKQNQQTNKYTSKNPEPAFTGTLLTLQVDIIKETTGEAALNQLVFITYKT